jgi:hypothetical protein
LPFLCDGAAAVVAMPTIAATLAQTAAAVAAWRIRVVFISSCLLGLIREAGSPQRPDWPAMLGEA